MRLTTMRDQVVFHLRRAHELLNSPVDHDMTVAEWVAVDTTTRHVAAALRALGNDPDLREYPNGGN